MSFFHKTISEFSRPASPSFGKPAVLDSFFYCFVLCWFIYWSILPLIALDNEFIDALENIVWGSHFQFGYDKNPYLGAWLGHGAWIVTGKSLWINSFLCQAFVLLGLCSVYALARKILSPALALISVLSLTAINFYGIKSVEFCDDVMELGLWPLVILFFYRALTKGNRFRDWTAVGVFLEFSFMTKYYALVIAIPMLFILFFTEKGRAAWKSPAIYVAIVLGVVISLPNLIWLFRNDMVAVNYALDRAAISGGQSVSWTRHLTKPYSALRRALGVVVIPFVFLLALVFPRPVSPGNLSEQERFDRFFLYCFALGPMGITLLFSLCTGASINYSWVVPCFPLLPLLVIFLLRPMVNEARLRYFLSCMIGMGLLFGVIFIIRSVYWQAYSKSGCDYENYPGKMLSAKITADWHSRYGTPLPFVIGDREATCNIAVYSPDHPEAYFSANRNFSQWIDEAEIARKGAVLLWENHENNRPQFLKRFTGPEWNMTPTVTILVPRATPAWFRKLIGRTPKMFTASYCFIQPSGNHGGERNKTGKRP